MKHVLHPGHQRPLPVSFHYQLKLKFTTANSKYKGFEIRLTFTITENGISIWRVQWVIFKTWTWLFMTFLDGTFLTFWRISRYFLHCIVFTVFFLVFDIFDFLDLLNCVFIIGDSIIVLRFLQFIKVLKYISGSNSSKSRQKSRRNITYHVFLEYLQRLHPHPRQKLLLRTYPTLILSINTVWFLFKTP